MAPDRPQSGHAGSKIFCWTYTLCGLKAYVQFGINLRSGINRRLTDV
jgi:hypothetical protein